MLVAMLGMLTLTVLCGCGRSRLLSLDELDGMNNLQKKRYIDAGAAKVQDYYSTPASNEPVRTQLRNEITYGLLSIAEHDSMKYMVELSVTRRATNLGTDLVELGLASAATITNGEQAKTVLSGLTALAAGTRISIDKNLFYEQTMPAIVSAIRAEQAVILERIRAKLLLPDRDYPLGAALLDVYEYYATGTITYGARKIAEKAAAQAVIERDQRFEETFKPLLDAEIDKRAAEIRALTRPATHSTQPATLPA
jgi:hypothetical protein